MRAYLLIDFIKQTSQYRSEALNQTVCTRGRSLRDIEVAQSELANALDWIELQQMVGLMATQYQRLAAKAERDGQYASAVGALNALRAMVCNRN